MRSLVYILLFQLIPAFIITYFMKGFYGSFYSAGFILGMIVQGVLLTSHSQDMKRFIVSLFMINKPSSRAFRLIK